MTDDDHILYDDDPLGRWYAQATARLHTRAAVKAGAVAALRAIPDPDAEVPVWEDIAAGDTYQWADPADPRRAAFEANPALGEANAALRDALRGAHAMLRGGSMYVRMGATGALAAAVRPWVDEVEATLRLVHALEESIVRGDDVLTHPTPGRRTYRWTAARLVVS